RGDVAEDHARLGVIRNAADRLPQVGVDAGRDHGAPRARVRKNRSCSGVYFACRSRKVLPPFILWVSGASMSCTVTASAGTLQFFITASVMSLIIPFFCSSLR